jgi:hypothetical protein
MAEKFLSPLNPVVFQAIFSKSPLALSSFLASVLNRPAKDLSDLEFLKTAPLTKSSSGLRALSETYEIRVRTKWGQIISLRAVDLPIPGLLKYLENSLLEICAQEREKEGKPLSWPLLGILVCQQTVYPEDSICQHILAFEDPDPGEEVPNSVVMHILEPSKARLPGWP